ncbi:hypothetical protein CTheo_6381 [Ceratobasidium theobromae]|uniref:Chromo domain-containing protein n=1 Tax=Ceratobasidium theobromae TaxID=1582974 RepID=A0A5N5QFE3_9AGAM|nr:hypothetical protein CTheo_6381 [Ceratobasidium theobromae]
MFHVNLLSKFKPDTEFQWETVELPPTITEDREEEYKVDHIVDSEFDKEGTLCFRIRWKGYGPDWDTWEPLEHLDNANEKLQEFYADNPDAPKQGNRPKPVKRRRRKAVKLQSGCLALVAPTPSLPTLNPIFFSLPQQCPPSLPSSNSASSPAQGALSAPSPSSMSSMATTPTQLREPSSSSLAPTSTTGGSPLTSWWPPFTNGAIQIEVVDLTAKAQDFWDMEETKDIVVTVDRSSPMDSDRGEGVVSNVCNLTWDGGWREAERDWEAEPEWGVTYGWGPYNTN